MNRLAAQRRMWMLKKAKEQELKQELDDLAEQKKKKVVWSTVERKEREGNI